MGSLEPPKGGNAMEFTTGSELDPIALLVARAEEGLAARRSASAAMAASWVFAALTVLEEVGAVSPAIVQPADARADLERALALLDDVGGDAEITLAACAAAADLRRALRELGPT
jgi:hypothetical protein